MLSPRVFGFQGRGPPNPISSWRIVRAGGGAEPSVSTPGVWRPPASSPQPLLLPQVLSRSREVKVEVP